MKRQKRLLGKWVPIQSSYHLQSLYTRSDRKWRKAGEKKKSIIELRMDVQNHALGSHVTKNTHSDISESQCHKKVNETLNKGLKQ